MDVLYDHVYNPSFIGQIIYDKALARNNLLRYVPTPGSNNSPNARNKNHRTPRSPLRSDGRDIAYHYAIFQIER